MVHTEQWVPGNIVSPNVHTLPANAPGMATIVSAQILRAVGFTVAAHTGANIAAGLADHVAHGHNLTTVVAAGGGSAVTEPVIPGPLESAGGGQVNPAVVDVLAAAQAHGAGAALAHVIGTGNPVVAAVATRVSRTTLTLNVDTLVGDILEVRYVPEGFQIRS